MKDSVTVERITNARLLDTVHSTHTHTYLQRRNADTYTHTQISMQVHTHTQGRQIYTHCHATGSYSPDLRANGSWSVGVGGEMGRRIDGWVAVDLVDEEI